ncbi:hypothetical protein ACTMSW_26195 [Micromonospora sp. BQ11]|uniref:hypothetical protein n=1 Tax=Micromonospora sp. BQ11 TaxID=3452212 RepID=UPI003F893660
MTDEQGWWRDDDRLLTELGAAVQEGRQVPESFVRAGKAAYAWRTVDAELAELRLDSRLAEPEPVGLRGEPSGPGSGPRALSFTASGLAIEVEIHPDAIRGQLVPAQPGVVRIRDAEGATGEVPVDEFGWFVVGTVPVVPFRLQARTEAGMAVITDWIMP